MFVYVYLCVCVCVLAKNCAWTFGNDVSSSNSSEKRKSKLLLLKRAQAEQIFPRLLFPFFLGAIEHRRRRSAFVLQVASLPVLPKVLNKVSGHINVTSLCLCVCVRDNCNRLTCRLITVWGRQKQWQLLEMCQIWRQA